MQRDHYVKRKAFWREKRSIQYIFEIPCPYPIKLNVTLYPML